MEIPAYSDYSDDPPTENQDLTRKPGELVWENA